MTKEKSLKELEKVRMKALKDLDKATKKYVELTKAFEEARKKGGEK